MTSRGLLIAFEGGDGSGKSTQAGLLAERLGAIFTRQPGGTPFGQRVRSLILDPENANLSIRAQALLFMADRAEQIDKLISPALQRGQHVVTDRYAYSSFVYQGFGHGLDVDELRQIADWSVQGVWPDMVIFLDVPIGEGLARVASSRALDHYEQAGESLQRMVVDGYHTLAANDERWKIVDGIGSIQEVADRIWKEVEPILDV